MKSFYASIPDIIGKKVECPLPLEVIPNNMGINLCSVDAVSWQRQDDGQLTSLTILFVPANDSERISMPDNQARVHRIANSLRGLSLSPTEYGTIRNALDETTAHQTWAAPNTVIQPIKPCVCSGTFALMQDPIGETI